MRNPFACAAVLVIISFTHLPAAAQTSQPLPPATADNSKSFAIPRLADGHPNLQGLWHNEVGTAALRQAGLGDIHSPGTPLPLPYLPVPDKIREYRLSHDPYHDPEAHCHVPGVPRETEQPSSLFPFKIIQDEKYVTILYEYVHDVRIIPQDGSAHPKNYWAWDGDSRGHWDGDTFVVDVANFNGKEVINLSSNNYLGLTTHPKLRRAAIDATRRDHQDATRTRLHGR